MAGDWIKMRSNIKDDPDVVVMAGALSVDEFSIVGRLHATWAWLDQHSEDGTNVRITSAYLDRLTACPGFADALRTVGWLDGRDGSLTFPNFDRHNGESAKRRAVETKRKQAQRDNNNERDKCPNNGGTTVLESLGPEKRREYKKEEAREREREEAERKIAIAQAWNAGVPEDFASYVFDDWFSREGKDGAGVKTTFPALAKKRWNRESQAWKDGSHKAMSANGSQPTRKDVIRSETAEIVGADGRGTGKFIAINN